MKAYINGRPVYCIQRGYPFRSAVSELQMVNVTFDNGTTGTIAANMRYLLFNVNDNYELEMFRGWGTWSLNGDHTDAAQSSTDGAPASSAWQEEFDEDMEDDEDDNYNNRHQSSDTVRRWTVEVKPYMTGHEGAVDTFATKMKKISYAQAGVNMQQVYAMAITNYYCWEDPDAQGYSDTARYQAKQAIDWAIEYKFITTSGGTGKWLRVIYKDSTGKYGRNGAYTYTGSCDDYIKTTIGGQYEALKLYRQIVWKTTNMRMIPSFSYKIDDIGSAESIKLYWDEEQHLYTTTVSDANGVLDYFDFDVPGCTVTNNGDGTLTISTPNQIGTITSSGSQSKLEPSDGIFKLPDFYRWDLEGKRVTYTYTMFVADYLQGGTGGSEYFVENGSGKQSFRGMPYNHSHEYSPACNWFCTKDEETITHCTEDFNDCDGEANNCSHSCNNDCESTLTCTIEGHHHEFYCYTSSCGHEHTEDCHECTVEDCHEHVDECMHKSTCSFLLNKGNKEYCNSLPTDTEGDECDVKWCCGKQHYNTVEREITGTYIDWQDLSGVYARGQRLIDPEICYIKVETVPHEFPAQTDTEVLLIADNDEWNDLIYTMPNGERVRHSSHLRVGEKYHLKYIYSYTGASKGFRIEFSALNKPYYQYNYLARMQSPQNTTKIFDLRNGLSNDRFSAGAITVPNAKLVIDKTPITIRGVYTTGETAYTLNGTYTYNSGSNWNDSVYLDALTTDQFDDGYDNKSADNYNGWGERITTSNSAPELTDFKVTKQNNTMQVTWVYDTKPEVFTSALVFGTAYISVGENNNYVKNYYDSAYNYAKDRMQPTAYTNWYYNFEDHNNVGGTGYFSTAYVAPQVQSEQLIPSHTVYTQNNEYLTYAVKNKVWQSDLDIKVSNFVQNTGAGITEHTYQDRERDNHDINYNLYYTIDVENPKATIFEHKERAYDGKKENNSDSKSYDTTSDVYEFDVNTLVSWGSTGASQTPASYGTTTVVDHIKTGRTYIQREIPTVLATMKQNPKAAMTMKIYPNYDRLIYEDYYSGVSVTGTSGGTRFSVPMKDSYYPENEQTASSDIYAAMNPQNKEMQPQDIRSSGNVPDQRNQNDTILHHINPTTTFKMRLSDGQVRTISDSNTKNYNQYNFAFNTTNRNNRVIFKDARKSAMFFKYSKTNYSYNANVQSALGTFAMDNKSQTESYYISQVLFKSNYTSKYMKELEAQGADYIKDTDANGNVTDAWIDMVNQNKFAIVSAGQGFELKVTVKYENSNLTQYLARYFGVDDAQNETVNIGTSNRIKHNYHTNTAEPGRQFCNISALTGRDDRGIPYYRDTERVYISSYNVLDRLAVNLVTGSNVYKDLYCFMNDNPDVVYSYSGIYDTPVIFDRKIKYSDDFSVTTITYTMCLSKENGISSSLQRMKFYTNQLAPDKKSPGIVEGTYDTNVKGEHSITLWTPVVAATPFDYPNTIQERYIGDAIELGYTIKTTAADDSIVHIVQ